MMARLLTTRLASHIPALLVALATLWTVPKAEAALLVGNTDSSNIVFFDENTGLFGGEFIAAPDGLISPDDLTFGPDGNLYVSYVSSKDKLSGAILRFDPYSGQLLNRFDQGGSIRRPYGLAFGPDGNLYVSSFRSDQILRYNGSTGSFIDVFASGSGFANGLNGPNDLLFDSKGRLYVTTQGSVADAAGDISFKFDSQVLRYDLNKPNQPTVFVPQPTPGDAGFISFLGLALGPKGDLFVSDFANDIRRYDLESGQPIATIPTNFTGTKPSNNFLGNLTFGPNNTLYTVGFDFTQKNKGAILRFDGETGTPLPAPGQPGAILAGLNPNLQRPIGIAYTSKPVPEPSTLLASAAGVGLLTKLLRRRKRDRSLE